MHTKENWEWKPLESFRCLRWRFMMTGTSTLTAVQCAEKCVEIMLTLCGEGDVLSLTKHVLLCVLTSH